MKDNIDGKYIGNRKIIIEIRFEPKVIMLDKRGELVEKLRETEAFNVFNSQDCHCDTVKVEKYMKITPIVHNI